MKTAKIVFSLLILSFCFAIPCQVTAQTPTDTLYNSVDQSAPDSWHFSFKHSGSGTFSVSNIIISFDSTQYPDISFEGNDIGQPLVPNAWFVNNTSDTAIWCADQGYNFILRNAQDSFFGFTIQPNPNRQNLNEDSILYYPILINWTANWGTGNECSNLSFLSSGSFYIEDLPWQDGEIDTVTATSSSPGCDPIFDFTVHNRNSLSFPIDGLSFQSASSTSGTIRPSDIQLPSGWIMDSAVEQTVYCHGPGISEGQALGGFQIGLRANSNVSEFSFAWQAFSGGIIIDADTVWNIPATVPGCSVNQSADTAVISNSLKCSFTATLENYHTFSAITTSDDSVSTLTGFVLSTPTPGVTFATATLPPFSIYPWAKGWNYSGKDSSRLTFYIPNKPANYAMPGGISAPFGFAINNPNQTPVTVNWQTLNFGSVISSGTSTIACTSQPTHDTAWLVGTPNGCEYELVVENIHKPTSNIQGVAVQMPPANGTFSTVPGTFSGPAGWVASFGNGLLFKNNTGSDIGTSDTDTFFFTALPNTPGTPWQLMVLTFQTGSANQELSSDTINAPGCTPAFVCDTVTEKIGTLACVDTLTVLNRRANAIDSVKVIPMDGWHIVSANAVIPWGPGTIDPGMDSALYVGTLGTELPETFFVSFNNGPNTNPFPVVVKTYSGGVECATTVMMTCATAAVALSTDGQTQDLALTVVPNPMNGRSDIGFTLGTFSGVNLMLVDILGRTQATLFSGTLPSGDHILPLDASSLAPGTYYLRLEAEGQRVTKKIVVEH